MTATEQYFHSLERRLLEDFNRIRATNKDSDVKGDKNERIVAEFIGCHYQAGFVVRNIEIIDSYGWRSQEIDICVCNTDQPVRVEAGEIVIAEGVDFVIQVKAHLNSAEVERIVTNCSSIKQLRRKFDPNDQIYGSKNDREFFVDRIPYLIVAFSAKMRLQTLWEKLRGCPKLTALSTI